MHPLSPSSPSSPGKDFPPCCVVACHLSCGAEEKRGHVPSTPALLPLWHPASPGSQLHLPDSALSPRRGLCSLMSGFYAQLQKEAEAYFLAFSAVLDHSETGMLSITIQELNPS